MSFEMLLIAFALIMLGGIFVLVKRRKSSPLSDKRQQASVTHAGDSSWAPGYVAHGPETQLGVWDRGSGASVPEEGGAKSGFGSSAWGADAGSSSGGFGDTGGGDGAGGGDGVP